MILILGIFAENKTMASILAFAGSNASTSINYKLIQHTTTLLGENSVEVKDMSTFNLPIYSEDLEKNEGFPDNLVTFMNIIKASDGLLISLNEHNGGFSAFFKNILDWLSRMERSFLAEKKVFLMATSPGKRGAIGSLETGNSLLPRFGADIVATFSFPSFYENFDASGITEESLKNEHQEKVNLFLEKL